jgi:hypothetical protein
LPENNVIFSRRIIGDRELPAYDSTTHTHNTQDRKEDIMKVAHILLKIGKLVKKKILVVSNKIWIFHHESEGLSSSARTELVRSK